MVGHLLWSMPNSYVPLSCILCMIYLVWTIFWVMIGGIAPPTLCIGGSTCRSLCSSGFVLRLSIRKSLRAQPFAFRVLFIFMSFFLAVSACNTMLVTILSVMISLAQWTYQWLAVCVKKEDCVIVLWFRGCRFWSCQRVVNFLMKSLELTLVQF